MIVDCLRANFDAGADMLPTQKNAEALFILGHQASLKGEPCLVAEPEGYGVVGYTLWCDLENPLGLDYRGRILYGLGTYVRPGWRQQGVSAALRDEAEKEGARLGFIKVVGVAYHDVGLRSVLARGYRAAGVHVEKVLV